MNDKKKSTDEIISDVRLITCDNGDGSVGVGFSAHVGEKIVRCGVRLPQNPTQRDFMAAWTLLAKAINDPLNPKYKPAINDACLVGNEMKIEGSRYYGTKLGN